MNNINSNALSMNDTNRWTFWLIGVALLAGLTLSLLSWIELCVEHCSSTQDYRLFGMPFATVGIPFFMVLTTLHFFSRRYQNLIPLVNWMIASALGAELMFILVQKYKIGFWCPVCLSIAATVGFAALLLFAGYLKELINAIQHHNRGETMQKFKQGLTSASFLLLGFLMAFIGITKPDFAEAAMNEMKDKMSFGTKNSPVEVYFITDWYCPSCRKVDPIIEKIYPQIKDKVTFYFIDFPIHKKSLNFSPYNLAFLVNSKPEYFKARKMLHNVADKTESPSDDIIKKSSKKDSLTYRDLPFIEVKSGLDFFDQIVEKYNIHATPTIIIVNPRRNSVVKMEGRDEISEDKILNAIDKMTPGQ